MSQSISVKFVHPVTAEVKTIYLSKSEIQDQLSEFLYEKILECDCEPVGETNVVECGCENYLEEFEMMEAEQ